MKHSRDEGTVEERAEAREELTSGVKPAATRVPAARADDRRKIDKAFLVYLATAGDVRKTSVICRLPQARIQYIIEKENWAPKLEALEGLRKEGKHQQVAIELSRVASFVQASRMRELVDRGMDFVASLKNEKLFVHTSDRGARSVTAKVIIDLAKAMETAQACCARALGDKSVGEPLLGKDEAERSTALEVYESLTKLQSEPATDSVPTPSE